MALKSAPGFLASAASFLALAAFSFFSASGVFLSVFSRM
jgi:hypothetical protein